MFTDIMGYTAMMQRDERDAVAAIRRHQQVLEATVVRFGGELLQYYGDGSLSIFKSATEAVYCAAELQRQFHEPPYLPVRIGLHLGEIYFEGDQFMGDGVNVAARIQSEAEEGSVFASRALCDMVRNQPAIRTEYRGEKSLKNVKEPVKLYRIDTDQEFIPAIAPSASTIPRHIWRWGGMGLAGLLVLTAMIWLFLRPGYRVTDESIAVLPFDNFSEQREANQYLCDGIHEAVLNHLAQTGALQVKSRSSVEQFRDNRPAVEEIGRGLKTANILEGSVQRAGDRLRVTVQLFDVRSGNHFWSKTYDRQVTDILSLQNNIAAEVARELSGQLSPKEQFRLNRSPTRSFAAYDAYLRAWELQRNYLESMDPAKIEKAVRLYHKALELDSDFARAYVGLAHAYYQQFHWRPEEAGQKLDSVPLLIQEALDKDPNIPEGHLAAGIYALMERRDENVAMQHLQRTLALNPNLVGAHTTLATIYRLRGEPAKALHHLQRAVLLDPGDRLALYYCQIGFVYHGLCDFQEACINYEKALELKPGFPTALENLNLVWAAKGAFDSMLLVSKRMMEDRPGHSISLFWMANSYMELGQYRLARQYYEKLYALPADYQRFHYFDSRHRYGYVLWQLGEKELAKKQISQQHGWYLERWKDSDSPRVPDKIFAYDLAAIHAFLGERDEALKWLREFEAFGWHWGSPFYIRIDKMFESLRGDPEFEALVQKALEDKARQRAALAVEAVN